MHTHFKTLLIRILFLFLPLMAGIPSVAQNSLQVSVTPPYTNRLADYSNSPNKITAIVTINGSTTPGYSGNIYFRGILKSSSGDIEISTKPGFKPITPVRMPPSIGGAPVTYVLPFDEIKNLFDWNNLTYRGITMENVMRYGMPEDVYQFCIQTFDYESDAVLIDESCSAPFNVTMLEPPTIVSPVNESTLMYSDLQSVLFQWLQPPFAPFTTQYTLRVIEVVEGVNSHDALLSSAYPMRFFETSMTGVFSYLYTNATPRFEPGKTYACAVIASDSETPSIFRNNGMSEVHTFTLEHPVPVVAVPENDNPQQLLFVNPHATFNSADINSQSAFMLLWGWQGISDISGTGAPIPYETLMNMQKAICDNMNVKQFRLSISAGKKTPSAPLSYQRNIGIDAATSELPHHFIITKENVASIGLRNGYWYKATVEALGANNSVIASAGSVDFQYNSLPESQKSVKLQGQVDYVFDEMDGGLSHHAANTTVTIKAYKFYTANGIQMPDQAASGTAGGIQRQDLTASGNAIANGIQIPIQTAVYAQTTAVTNGEGAFNVDLPLPADASVGDSIRFTVTSDNPYYLGGSDFKETRIRLSDDTTTVILNQLLAHTKAYSLKIYVAKRFIVKSQYDVATLLPGVAPVMQEGTADLMEYLPEGVDIVVYRNTKRSEIPPIEGNITSSGYAYSANYIEVARGKTQLEVAGNEQKSFVEFHRLFASYLDGDEYIIQAINEDGTPWNDGKEDVAPAKVYKLPAQESNQRYRHVSTAYHFESYAPAQSNIKGQLVYKWKTDPEGVVRPIANTPFKVVVNYIIDGRPVMPEDGNIWISDGDYTNSYIDNWQEVGSGTTDDNGNFDISIANTNIKGNVGYGGAQKSTYHPVLYKDQTLERLKAGESIFDIWVDPRMDPRDKNPYDYDPFGFDPRTLDFSKYDINQSYIANSIVMGSDFAMINIQAGLNNDNGLGIAPAAGGGFTVTKTTATAKTAYTHPDTPDADRIWLAEAGNSRGPSAPLNPLFIAQNPSTQLAGNMQRVFRIVPEEEYYYPSMNDIVVQPLQSIELTEPQLSYVREVSVTVSPVNNNGQTISEMSMIVFRDVNTKKSGMPTGEGDGKYNFAELINAQYGDNYNPGGSTDGLPTGEDLFKKEFEHVWSQTQVPKNDDGRNTITFQRLLHYFRDYYIEAFPPQEEGTNYYKATFVKIAPGSYSYDDSDGGGYNDPAIWYKGGAKQSEVVNITMQMQALTSRMMIRTLDKDTQQGLANANVFVKSDNTNWESARGVTDKDGWLQKLASEEPLKSLVKTSNTGISAYANAKGYNASDKIDGHLAPTGTQITDKLLLQPSGNLNITIFETLPNGTKKGVQAFIGIDSANWKETNINGVKTMPVPARTETKVHVKPFDLAYFDEVKTLGELGFTDTGSDNITGSIEVTRKKHRIEFWVKDDKTNAVIPNAVVYVYVGDTLLTAKQTASVPCNFEFENVSEDYSFVFRGPDNSDYIPVIKNVYNQESKNTNVSTVFLSKGSRITGVVRLDNQPVRNAKVYLGELQQITTSYGGHNMAPWEYLSLDLNGNFVQNSSGSGSEELPVANSLIVAYTNANGEYTLRGVPVHNATVDVLATLDTTFTVVGARAQASIQNDAASGVNLNLTKYDGMIINNLYGFPLSVESLTTNADNTVTVSGLIDWKEGLSDFDIRESSVQLRVENVKFSADSAKVGVAVVNKVTLQGVTNLKLGYQQGKYNVMLTHSERPSNSIVSQAGGGNSAPKDLEIGRNADGNGSIYGKMQIVDNSFNYTASYLNFTREDNFYLATIDDGKINNIIQTVISPSSETTWSAWTSENYSNTGVTRNPAMIDMFSQTVQAQQGISAQALQNVPAGLLAHELQSLPERLAGRLISLPPKLSFSPTKLFYLSNVDGNPIDFKLLEFNARANPTGSYLSDDGKIHLNVDLACHIPNAKPENITVNIKDMVLDNHTVYPGQGDTLNVQLGEWTLAVKKWKISAEEGGITSTDAIIRTGVIDIPVNRFVLRNDMFLMTPDTLYNNLTIGGGIAKVEVDGNAKAVLLWDANTGDDHKGHWRFSIAGQGDSPAAKVPLRDLHSSSGQVEPLQVKYLQILDNNAMTLSFASGQKRKILNNPLADFTVNSIFNGPNFINVNGMLNIGGPNIPEMGLTLIYTGQQNNQTMTPDNVKLDFIPNVVHFTADSLRINTKNIRIFAQRVEIDGIVCEHPKTFNNIPATLTAAISGGVRSYGIAVKPGWVLQLSEDTGSAMGDNVQVVDNLKTGFKVPINTATSGTKVQGGNWNLFTFEGTMIDNAHDDGIGDNNMKFTVYGEVLANSDAIGLTDIQTPMGGVSLVYYFKEKRFLGSLTLKHTKIPIVPPLQLEVIEGICQVVIDRGGFCIYSTLLGHVDLMPSCLGQVALGTMMGYYTNQEFIRDQIWPLVNKHKSDIMKNDCYRKDILEPQGLKGFYVTGEFRLLDIDLEIDLFITGAGIKVKSFMAADFFCNFGSPMVAGASANYLAECGLYAKIPLLSISGRRTDIFTFDFGYSSQNKLTMQGLLGLEIEAGVKLSYLVGTVEYSETINCYATFDDNRNLNIHFGTGNITKQKCPPYSPATN